MALPPPQSNSAHALSEASIATAFALVVGLFAFLTPGRLEVLLIGAGVGAAAAFALRRWVARGGREGALVVTVVVIGLGAGLAPPTFGAEALAGLAAITALLWAAADPKAPSSIRFRLSGVVLPALALAVAVVISGILPGTTALVGVAVALVLAVVLWVAYVLSRPNPFRAAASVEEEPS